VCVFKEGAAPRLSYDRLLLERLLLRHGFRHAATDAAARAHCHLYSADHTAAAEGTRAGAPRVAVAEPVNGRRAATVNSGADAAESARVQGGGSARVLSVGLPAGSSELHQLDSRRPQVLEGMRRGYAAAWVGLRPCALARQRGDRSSSDARRTGQTSPTPLEQEWAAAREAARAAIPDRAQCNRAQVQAGWTLGPEPDVTGRQPE
jgi:hypothetical protein